MTRLWIAGFSVVCLVSCGGEGSGASAGSSASGGSSSSASASGSGSSSGGGGGGQGGASTSGAGGAGGGVTGSGGGSAVWGPSQCPAPPAGVNVGFNVGDQLADVIVKDCDGNDVSLQSYCGADALFIFAAHGWCPLCKSVSSQIESIHDSFAGMNLATVNIVVETGLGAPPDADYCKLWRQQNGEEDVVTLYDPTGAVLALWPGGSSSLSAYVDKDRLITGKLVHTADISLIKGEIQGALSK